MTPTNEQLHERLERLNLFVAELAVLTGVVTMTLMATEDLILNRMPDLDDNERILLKTQMARCHTVVEQLEAGLQSLRSSKDKQPPAQE